MLQQQLTLRIARSAGGRFVFSKNLGNLSAGQDMLLRRIVWSCAHERCQGYQGINVANPWNCRMCWCERTPLEHRLYSARGGTGLCAACHEWTVDMLKRWFKPLTQYASCLLHGDRRKEDEDIAQEALFCCFKGVMNGSWSRNV